MAAISTDLKKTARDISVALLSPALASAADLMLSTKEAHWNVRGPNFMAVHLFFDKLNEEVSVYVDDLAERIVQMGGYAHGTLRDTVGATLLPAYPETSTAKKTIWRPWWRNSWPSANWSASPSTRWTGPATRTPPTCSPRFQGLGQADLVPGSPPGLTLLRDA